MKHKVVIATLSVITAISLAGVSACRPKATPAPGSSTGPTQPTQPTTVTQTTVPSSTTPGSNYLAQLQQNGHLTVTFQAVMTFLSSSKTVVFPSQLFVPAVLVWCI